MISHQQKGALSLFIRQESRKIGPFSIDSVHLMDCVDAMRQIPNDSVDLVVADPPYNASKGNEWKWDNSVTLPGFGGNWSKIMSDWDAMPLADYWNFTLAWLSEIKRVVRSTGSIWVHGTYHNIGIINFAMQMLELEIINEVVWYKRNSFPNLSGRRLTASHETILWAHTGGKKRKYYFNYEAAKAMSLAGDSLKKPGKQLRTVWDIPNNKQRRELSHGKHPAQKPLRLLKRMLAISSRPGDTVLAPFSGSGTECVAAKEMGLHFLGFETNPSYFDISQERLGYHRPNLPLPLSSDDKSENQNIQVNVPSVSRLTSPIPPLIKWTGSKRLQASMIARHIPRHKCYYEPFLGGGALLYLIGRTGSVAGDIYEPLIQLWKVFQTDPDSVVYNYSQQWAQLQRSLPEYYYAVRDRFNRNPDPYDLNFLTRTCVNGIVRFNQNGEFNNSFHLSRKGMKPERFAKVVDSWHEIIQGVNFVCQDYEETLSGAQEGDFVYFDPPYANSNMRYTRNLELGRFFRQLLSLNRRGVKWILSFDGQRGDVDLSHPVPEHLYRRKLAIPNGHSAIGKVLNGPLEQVHESLYLNY
ncbi:MAG: Dam family site-specific DNA-(adenine-N6)-methyltransferase [Caldilineaceae bacterium]|nr:Dam family site-specific DNA-(adenine-N6)-methyltransferase [Caldilineaceae bacterium]